MKSYKSRPMFNNVKDHDYSRVSINDYDGNQAKADAAGQRVINDVRDGKITLEKGSMGQGVKALQMLLNQENPKLELSEDGRFGTKTEEALRNFLIRLYQSRTGGAGVADKIQKYSDRNQPVSVGQEELADLEGYIKQGTEYKKVQK